MGATLDDVAALLRTMITQQAELIAAVVACNAFRPQTSTERSRKWRQEKGTKSVPDGTNAVASEAKSGTKRVASSVASSRALTDSTDLRTTDLRTTDQEDRTSRGGVGERHATKNVPVLDEAIALRDAAKRSVPAGDVPAHVDHFRNFWDSRGWKGRQGPIKDANAAFRTWLDMPFREREGAPAASAAAKIIPLWQQGHTGELEL